MIDYSALGHSVLHYSEKGFTQIEVPWTVTQAISDITRPKDAKDFKLIHEDNKVLVASAEQGFLYLGAKGFLPAGRYQAISPCFRKEPFGPFHTKYFMKNELISIGDKDESEELVDIALSFFNTRLPEFLSNDIDVVSTEQGFDIELGGIEIGSYGFRSCEFMSWTYATGLAEPRFSNAVKALVGK